MVIKHVTGHQNVTSCSLVISFIRTQNQNIARLQVVHYLILVIVRGSHIGAIRDCMCHLVKLAWHIEIITTIILTDVY